MTYYQLRPTQVILERPVILSVDTSLDMSTKQSEQTQKYASIATYNGFGVRLILVV